jgi:tetratricopeptide (TPR) repeat protein
MSDPVRTSATSDSRTLSPEKSAERDAKIESLLLAGLDHYFAGDYAQAIDVWTRALFLDRTHQRARAYIERARSAMAEQQRESEELLHNGVAAFERGELGAARQLLNAAVKRGGAHDVALAFLTRIDRIIAAAPSAPPEVATPARAAFPVTVPSSARVPSPWRAVLFLAAVLAVAGTVAVTWDELRMLVSGASSGLETESAAGRSVQEPLLVPRSGETAIERARALAASGKLYDALRAVELVRATDPLRADADKLKADIQRELLAHHKSAGGIALTKP